MRASRRRRRKAARAFAAILLVPAAVLGVDFALYGSRIHPGVEVGETPVGGLDSGSAVRLLDQVAAELGARPISFRWRGLILAATPSRLGWRPDVQATALAALAVGHEGPLWTDARTRLLSWLRPTTVRWRGAWDADAAQRGLDDWSRRVDRPPVEGSVWVEDGAIRSRYPAPGTRIDREEILSLAAGAVERDVAPALPLPVAIVRPRSTSSDVEQAASEVRDLLSGPVSVRIGGLRRVLLPRDLAPLVRTSVVGNGPAARLAVSFSPESVAALFEPIRHRIEEPARSARFVVIADRVRIHRSEPGRILAAGLAARALLEIASSSDRAGRVPLERVPARLTTREARSLGIVEPISSFTTYHEPGEPRVTNIHLAADILDGAIVMPGERFSLNRRLGPRTAERGFVEAPVIYNGEFTTDIGGGVSQLATTTFNAAFFAGYPFLEFKPHSYYISRYPMGREATVSWPGPDLVFRNDTTTAVLIKTSYTDSSITVSMYGSGHGREVRATEPVIVSRTETGFSVVVERIVETPGEPPRHERFITFYRYG